MNIKGNKENFNLKECSKLHCNPSQKVDNFVKIFKELIGELFENNLNGSKEDFIKKAKLELDEYRDGINIIVDKFNKLLEEITYINKNLSNYSFFYLLDKVNGLIKDLEGLLTNLSKKEIELNNLQQKVERLGEKELIERIKKFKIHLISLKENHIKKQIELLESYKEELTLKENLQLGYQEDNIERLNEPFSMVLRILPTSNPTGNALPEKYG